MVAPDLMNRILLLQPFIFYSLFFFSFNEITLFKNQLTEHRKFYNGSDFDEFKGQTNNIKSSRVHSYAIKF